MARIHILRDIADLGLDPKLAYTAVKGGGRLKAPAPVEQPVEQKSAHVKPPVEVVAEKPKKPKGPVVHKSKTDAASETPEASEADKKSEEAEGK